jgi:hypothetical protein
MPKDYRNAPGYYDRLTKALAALSKAGVALGLPQDTRNRLSAYFGYGVAVGQFHREISNNRKLVEKMCELLELREDTSVALQPAPLTRILAYIRGEKVDG